MNLYPWLLSVQLPLELHLVVHLAEADDAPPLEGLLEGGLARLLGREFSELLSEACVEVYVLVDPVCCRRPRALRHRFLV